MLCLRPLCLLFDPHRDVVADKWSMMMRFLCVRELQRFVPLSRVWTRLPCDSLALSQSQLGPGWRWICTSSSSSSPQRAPPGDGQLGQDNSANSADPLQDQSMGLAQRFKRTFKQYGKVMIPVHLLTSCMWFSGFYYAAMKWGAWT